MDEARSLAETRLQLALDAGRMGTWTSNLATGAQDWDQRQYELLGLPIEVTPARQLFLSLVLPEDRPAVEWTSRDLSPGARHGSQFRIRRPDGEVRWLASSSITQCDAAGRPIELVGINWDITEQKGFELSLVEAERRLSLATTAAKLGIWDWDIDSGEFFYSERARALYGFDPDTPITYERLRQRTHPEDYRWVAPMLERALSPIQRSEESYRYRITTADTGDERWLLAHGGAVFSGPGPDARPLRYTGTLQDVTSEVRMQQALEEEQARLRLALSAGDLALWELDVASNRLTHSPTLNRLYGFPEDSTPAYEAFVRYYAPGEQERITAESAASLARGETSLRLEIKHVWPDGTVKWIAVRAQVLLDGAGTPVRVIGVAMDVTERRRWEETLLVTSRELQHRVKNTLAVVQSLATQSFRRPDGMETFQGRLRALAAATDILTRDNWLSVPLGELVAEVIRPFDVDGRFDLDGDAAAVDSRNAANLSMALHELCTNAVKYGALSNARGRVSITWRSEDGMVALDWRERDGPPVAPPSRSGFGSKLLSSGLFSAAHGSIEITYPPEGLVAAIRLRNGSPQQVSPQPTELRSPAG